MTPAAATPVVEGRAIVQDYHIPGGMFARAKDIRALNGIDFQVAKGKTLAIVGESGSGKSTLARIIALIDAPSGGELLIEGKAVDVGLPGVTRDADGFRQVRQGQGFFAQGFDEVFEHGDYSESRARRKLGLPTFTVRAGMNCSRRALAQAENLVSETR